MTESTTVIANKAAHRFRCIRQWIRRPECAVIGCYHGGNAGDMALGNAVASVGREHAVRCDLQTIHNLQFWPATRIGIVGGGAVAYRASLQALEARFRDNPERLAILGVDFNDDSVIRDFSRFLRQVKMITCRSAAQAENLKSILKRDDIEHHLDLVFGERWVRSSAVSPIPERPNELFGINMPPLVHQLMNGKVITGSPFLKELIADAPLLKEDIERGASRYIQFFRSACVALSARGYRVQHVPFALPDAQFARIALEGLKVEFLPYSARTGVLQRRMRRFGGFLSGRFHSLVFSIGMAIPVIPFCYAAKSTELMRDVCGMEDNVLNLDRIVRGDYEELLNYWIEHPLTIPRERISDLSADTRRAMTTAFNRLRPFLT